MTRQTSIAAFHQIEAEGLLSTRRMDVYRLLYRDGPLTAAQITNHFLRQLGHAFNSGNFGTRLSELRNLGVVREVSTVKCPLTARTVILWDVTDALPKEIHASKRDRLVHKIEESLIKLSQLERDLELLDDPA